MKCFCSVIFLLLFSFSALAIDVADYDTVTLTNSPEKPTTFCPATKISDNNKCMSCHEMVPDENGNPKFGLKELDADAGYYDKPGCASIVWNANGKGFLRVQIKQTGSYSLRRTADYLYRHPEFTHVALHLFTPGGSVMDAWESVGIIAEMQSKGILVETHCYGMAASAGVILLVAGDVGHRYVNRHAEIMMHKVWNFSMFDLSDPDTAEDKAATLKHFQDNINSWIIKRTKLTSEKIEELIYKRDHWMTGEEAVSLGLADHMIN
jgi:ATP-dependent Clp protease protease subunit